MVKLKLVIKGQEKASREWVEVSENYQPTPEEIEQRLVISLPLRLKKKLDNINLLEKRKLDAPVIVFGAVGSGKSTLLKLCSWYCSKGTLTIKNFIAGNDIFQKLEDAPDCSDQIIDEAVLNLSAADANKEFSKRLVKVFSVIRQKRLRIWMAVPDFFALHKYIAVFRSLFVMRTYFDKDFNQGRFAYWGSKKKVQLYELGKRNFGSCAKPKADFISTFPDFTLPFEDEYDRLKKQSLRDALFGNDKPQDKVDLKTFEKEIKIKLFNQVYNNLEGISIKKLSQAFGVSSRTGDRWLATTFNCDTAKNDTDSINLIDGDGSDNEKEAETESDDLF